MNRCQGNIKPWLEPFIGAYIICLVSDSGTTTWSTYKARQQVSIIQGLPPMVWYLKYAKTQTRIENGSL